MKKGFTLDLVERWFRNYLAVILLALVFGSGIENLGQSCIKAQQNQTAQAMKAEDIREAEQRLFDLGYWTGPIDDVFDGGSSHSLALRVKWHFGHARKPR